MYTLKTITTCAGKQEEGKNSQSEKIHRTDNTELGSSYAVLSKTDDSFDKYLSRVSEEEKAESADVFMIILDEQQRPHPLLYSSKSGIRKNYFIINDNGSTIEHLFHFYPIVLYARQQSMAITIEGMIH